MKHITEHRVEVIVVGGGQAGLSMGYYLQKEKIPFLILNAAQRVGHNWRSRWDSLRLFTAAKYDQLPGMHFPAPPDYFPTKDEMGDYLESYARHFELPVLCGVRVESLWREGSTYKLKAGEKIFEAPQVVVAMSDYQIPKIPAFGRELDPAIVQVHAHDYKNPGQLKPGNVLIIGAGNSGAELAMELSKTHKVFLAGRDTGHLPFRVDGMVGRLLLVRLVLRGLFFRVFTTNTFIGRIVRKKVLHRGGPLIRQKPKMLAAAGVERLPKITGTRNGKPVCGEKTIDAANVIWCTGYYGSFSWIDLPVFKDHDPQQQRGVVPGEPGLYFLGLHFLYALSSAMIHGVSRDARYLANVIRQRLKHKPAETTNVAQQTKAKVA